MASFGILSVAFDLAISCLILSGILTLVSVYYSWSVHGLLAQERKKVLSASLQVPDPGPASRRNSDVSVQLAEKRRLCRKELDSLESETEKLSNTLIKMKNDCSKDGNNPIGEEQITQMDLLLLETQKLRKEVGVLLESFQDVRMLH